MKRSEMIDLVHQKLDEAWGYDNDLSKSQLSFILHLFERNGMLPPGYRPDDSNFYFAEEKFLIWDWKPEDV